MNIAIKNKSKIIICSIVLVLLLALVITVLIVRQAQPKEPVEKTMHVAYASWPYHDLESATAEATTIVYGRTVSKSGTKVHESTSSSGRLFREYYTDVEVEVIEILKGDMDARTINYREPCGETADTIYRIDGVEPIPLGEEFLFFLGKYGGFMNPSTLMPVSEDGELQISYYMRPENMASASKDGDEKGPETMPVEDYMELIREQLG